MITEQDFVIINYNKERDISAEYFAVQKILFRHPSLHTQASLEPDMERIKMEFLSEFAFMEYLLRLLDEYFPVMKWDISKIELSGRDALLAGIYDESMQRTVAERTIEIKTSIEEKAEIKDIPRRKLTTSKLEYPKSNLYVQSFILKNNDVALAGFVNDVPSIKDLANRTDYSIPVSEMSKMSLLLDEFRK